MCFFLDKIFLGHAFTVTFKTCVLNSIYLATEPKVHSGRKIHKLPESEYLWDREEPEVEKPEIDKPEVKKKLEFQPKSEPKIPEEIFDGGVRYLSESDLIRIEKRFKNRRENLSKSCLQQNREPVTQYENISQKSFFFNHIFHEPILGLSGCIPPKTGSTSWNHFWWGTSSFDGVGKGKFDSFQVKNIFSIF